MRERDVEKIFVEGIRARGGVAYKFVSPGNDGVPDRLVVLPDGCVFFVELKTETGKLSGLQKTQIGRLTERGASVAVLYGAFQVRDFLRSVSNGAAADEMQSGRWGAPAPCRSDPHGQ